MNAEKTVTPSDIMMAHQFLYYVLCKPVWSDRQYDEFCKRNNLCGGGGSDRYCDYPERIRNLAIKIQELA